MIIIKEKRRASTVSLRDVLQGGRTEEGVRRLRTTSLRDVLQEGQTEEETQDDVPERCPSGRTDRGRSEETQPDLRPALFIEMQTD